MQGENLIPLEVFAKAVFVILSAAQDLLIIPSPWGERVRVRVKK
jgi:hypothetical protein